MTITATWLGHSAVLLDTSAGRILIDPFITENPNAGARLSDLDARIVLLTHDHSDHYGDIEHFLGQGATFVGIHEYAVKFSEKGWKAEGMNIGGWLEVGGARIFMTHATHTCAVGHVAGFVVEIDGTQIYHAGDTGLTWDMKILGEFFKIDLAFLPIGDRYTMGARHAAIAAGWINARRIVPIHYATWPLIPGDTKLLKELLGERAAVLKAGESIQL